MSFSHEEIIPVKHLLKIHPRHLKDHKIQTQHSKDKKRKKKISTESYHKTSTLKHNKKKKKKDSYAITQPNPDLTITPILN